MYNLEAVEVECVVIEAAEEAAEEEAVCLIVEAAEEAAEEAVCVIVEAAVDTVEVGAVCVIVEAAVGAVKEEHAVEPKVKAGPTDCTGVDAKLNAATGPPPALLNTLDVLTRPDIVN